ncbi:MAG: tRNA (guanosine(37)-N1)-methyltransferase TrmD [Capsulimonadaceae bacterium]
MRFDVVTIFPDFVRAAVSFSIIKRARESGTLEVAVHDLRDFTSDRHRSTDDTPYGGGAGMVMRPGPIFSAVEAIDVERTAPVILLTPQGRPFSQAAAMDLATHERIILICGHYEGFDERVREYLAADEISIGDYVLTGGELPALVVIDAVARMVPGVLGNEGSSPDDSFAGGLLEYPHYTRPPDFRGWTVPDVLLSGHHAEIARWRRKEQFRRTQTRRPDLWSAFVPSTSDLKLLKQLSGESASSPVEESSEEKPFDASARTGD